MKFLFRIVSAATLSTLSISVLSASKYQIKADSWRDAYRPKTNSEKSKNIIESSMLTLPREEYKFSCLYVDKKYQNLQGSNNVKIAE